VEDDVFPCLGRVAARAGRVVCLPNMSEPRILGPLACPVPGVGAEGVSVPVSSSYPKSSSSYPKSSVCARLFSVGPGGCPDALVGPYSWL